MQIPLSAEAASALAAHGAAPVTPASDAPPGGGFADVFGLHAARGQIALAQIPAAPAGTPLRVSAVDHAAPGDLQGAAPFLAASPPGPFLVRGTLPMSRVLPLGVDGADNLPGHPAPGVTGAASLAETVRSAGLPLAPGAAAAVAVPAVAGTQAPVPGATGGPGDDPPVPSVVAPVLPPPAGTPKPGPEAQGGPPTAPAALVPEEVSGDATATPVHAHASDDRAASGPRPSPEVPAPAGADGTIRQPNPLGHQTSAPQADGPSPGGIPAAGVVPLAVVGAQRDVPVPEGTAQVPRPGDAVDEGSRTWHDVSRVKELEEAPPPPEPPVANGVTVALAPPTQPGAGDRAAVAPVSAAVPPSAMPGLSRVPGLERGAQPSDAPMHRAAMERPAGDRTPPDAMSAAKGPARTLRADAPAGDARGQPTVPVALRGAAQPPGPPGQDVSAAMPPPTAPPQTPPEPAPSHPASPAMPPPGRVPLGTAPMAARAQGTAPLAGWQLPRDGRDPGSPRSLPMPEAGRLPDTFGPAAVAPGSPARPATVGPAGMPGQAPRHVPRHVPPMPASPPPPSPLAVPPGDRVADRPMPPERAASHAPDPLAAAPAVAAAPPPPAGAMPPPPARPGPPAQPGQSAQLAQLAAQPETADAIRAVEAGADDLPGLANAGADPARLGATPASVHGVEMPRHVARQLAEALVPRPDGPVELRLNPEELGHVRITLSGDDGTMIVLVHADREDTAALLRRNADLLQQELRAAGYPDANLSFSGGDTPGQDRSGPSRSPEPDLAATAAPAGSRDQAGTVADPATPPDAPPDRLDLRL